MKWKPHLLRLVLALLCLARFPALAAEATGYVETRTQYARSQVHGLLPTDEQPELQQFLELNLQPRHEYRPGGFVSADLSLFLQGAWRYRGLDMEGREVGVSATEASAARPFLSLNELYVSHEVVPQFHLLAGKKRVVWGSGLAYNPTDLLNPAKDPTDPAFQRAGAYMVQMEVPLEKYTFSLLASPAVLKEQSGLPQAMLVWPSWDRQDNEAHYLVAARAYTLLANSDINLMLFFSNRYREEFENKLRLGFSFSRYFFNDYELHVEGLVGAGSARQYAVPECVESQQAAQTCLLEGRPLLTFKRLEENRLRPRLLVGTRYQFGDESLLSVEYLYQADGLKRGEFQHSVNALALLQAARRLGIDVPLPGQDSGQSGLPQKLSFDPLGRHYAFLSYQKPHIREDFTFTAVVVASLQDFSGLLATTIAWDATSWMTLTLSGFVPLSGPDSRAGSVPDSEQKVSEFDLVPFDYRGIFQVRIFY